MNLARPYPGYAGITTRQTTARSDYHALAVGLRYDSGRAGTVSVAYTLSRARATATNDRDGIDLPQDRTDLEAEYALARTDRTHVFTASWVYELPLFRGRQERPREGGPAGLAALRDRHLLVRPARLAPRERQHERRPPGEPRGRDWRPVRRACRRAAPGTSTGSTRPPTRPRADGAFGNTGRAPFRLPGVNQWDLTLAKTWSLPRGVRLQLRADFLNAWNHTQLSPDGIQNVCSALVEGTCALGGSDPFGRITSTRNPREIQLGLRLGWN